MKRILDSAHSSQFLFFTPGCFRTAPTARTRSSFLSPVFLLLLTFSSFPTLKAKRCAISPPHKFCFSQNAPAASGFFFGPAFLHLVFGVKRWKSSISLVLQSFASACFFFPPRAQKGRKRRLRLFLYLPFRFWPHPHCCRVFVFSKKKERKAQGGPWVFFFSFLLERVSFPCIGLSSYRCY